MTPEQTQNFARIEEKKQTLAGMEAEAMKLPQGTLQSIRLQTIWRAQSWLLEAEHNLVAGYSVEVILKLTDALIERALKDTF